MIGVARLTKADREALVMPVLELQERGLPYRVIAEKLGIREAQANRVLSDWRKKGSLGPCDCGETGTRQPDPYQLEIHDEVVMRFLCDGCRVETEMEL